MTSTHRVLMLAAALAAAGSMPAQAQIHITPAAGVFIPASDLEGVRDGAEQIELDRSGTLGLGLNIDAGWLRASMAYASGATITEEGTAGDIGEGSVLALAADLVVRPLPRMFVQPYLLGGVGLKRQDYSYNDEGVSTDVLPEEERDVALHVGVGADLMFGGLGVMAEVTDYITRTEDGGWGQHDAFVMVGLRVRLGGS